jgi:prolyl-tRNA synthetase
VVTVPSRVLLQPAASEYALYRQQYQTLVGDLKAKGVLARVVPIEKRGVAAGAAESQYYDLIIQVGEIAGAIVTYGTLVEIVRRRLKAHEVQLHMAPRRAKVYLASGDEHEFVLDEDESLQ